MLPALLLSCPRSNACEDLIGSSFKVAACGLTAPFMMHGSASFVCSQYDVTKIGLAAGSRLHLAKASWR